MIKQLLMLLVVIAVPAAAIAQPSTYKHDLNACRFDNGRPMDQIECVAMRKYFAAEDAKRAKQTAYSAHANSAFEADKAAERDQRLAKQAEADAARAEHDAKMRAELDQVRAKQEAEERAEAAQQARAVAAMKAKCGKDYKSPTIGMPITRAQECVTPMRVIAQLNRADGIVTTYEGGNAYFHVMDGRIVSWGKY